MKMPDGFVAELIAPVFIAFKAGKRRTGERNYYDVTEEVYGITNFTFIRNVELRNDGVYVLELANDIHKAVDKNYVIYSVRADSE